MSSKSGSLFGDTSEDDEKPAEAKVEGDAPGPGSPISPASRRMVVARTFCRKASVDKGSTFSKQIQILHPPTVIGDFYDFGSILGAGGYGSVMEILHAKTLRPYAGKVFQKSHFKRMRRRASEQTANASSLSPPADLTSGAPRVKMADEEESEGDEKLTMTDRTFRTIMEKLLNTDHPHIVSLVHVFEDNDNYYLVMPKCLGGSLYRRLVARHRPFEHDEVKRVGIQLLDALKYLHETCGMIHRDIKPDNAAYMTAEDNSPVVLLDFDLSYPMAVQKDAERHSMTDTFVLGTVGYLAPEILKHKIYSPQSDMYALGCTLVSLLKCALPHELAASDWDKIPPGTAEVLSCLLKTDPLTRPESVTQLLVKYPDWALHPEELQDVSPKFKRRASARTIADIRKSTKSKHGSSSKPQEQ